jgi:hypothetical protein
MKTNGSKTIKTSCVAMNATKVRDTESRMRVPPPSLRMDSPSYDAASREESGRVRGEPSRCGSPRTRNAQGGPLRARSFRSRRLPVGQLRAAFPRRWNERPADIQRMVLAARGEHKDKRQRACARLGNAADNRP